MKSIAELEEHFYWGDVVTTHVIGEYQIIEYSCPNGKMFHGYINFEDTNKSYDTLDKAITGTIICKYDGRNSEANKFLWKMIK